MPPVGAPRPDRTVCAAALASIEESLKAAAAKPQAASSQQIATQLASLLWHSDPDEARRTRRNMLGELCDRPVLVIGTHFAGATAGHIVRDGDTYRLAV